ncbi:hypothetical protein UFOVP1228_17 [uncultured Caudovirales phage]|uniref:Protein NO VEIN C-terminal domain-containing protein n=1 Tax=uncultured Caudovirales phage TaxID=2100421 RepID=A0A6J5RA54_9CAUD|nr:hypothetical protein UFOVP956_17 [uncultured Caudovirales phage]CAB4191257.1 hypothetical protein UFOVP1228_17 [uncultured Caudovirales phage]CAB4215398.1 hypothetical protein UFOVP1481_21 [uncultured Caudovirales phage]
MTVNIPACFGLGDASEKQVIKYFTNKGFKAIKVDHKTHNYDIEATDKNGNICCIEVKTFGKPGYTTFFAETVQISAVNKIESIPEYLEHYDEIAYVIQYNRLNGFAYFFDCATLAKYVLANKSTERQNGTHTAKGLLIPCESAIAGFKYKKFMGLPV